MINLYLVGCIGFHQSSCRFLSDLLSIFNDLIVKGFSIPPEFQDIAEKSCSTKFTEIEEGGFGDGEGQKDVSEALTSEDQLEEAMKPGTETEKEEKSDLKNEEDGIEMSEDFEGNVYDPDAEEGKSDEEEEEDDTENENELDKKMGDVNHSDADVLNKQLWSDEEEDEANESEPEDDYADGAPTNESLGLMPQNDNLKVEKEKMQTEDILPEESKEQNDEYDGEHENPSIDTSSMKEPEVIDVPDELEIDDNEQEMGEKEDSNEMDIDQMKDEDKQNVEDECENGQEDDAMKEEEIQLDSDETGPTVDNDNEDNSIVDAEMENNDVNLPSNEKSLAPEEISSSEVNKLNSQDVVQSDVKEGECQEVGDQHEEGKADATSYETAGHESKSLAKQRQEAREGNNSENLINKRKLPDQQRTLGDPSLPYVKKVKISEGITSHQNDIETTGEHEEYEHIIDDNDVSSNYQAVDSACQEQASKMPMQTNNFDEEEVIDISSSSDEADEEAMSLEILEGPSDSFRKRMKQNQKPGIVDYSDEELEAEDNDADYISTATVKRSSESLICTQRDLWSIHSVSYVEELRTDIIKSLEETNYFATNLLDMDIWQRCECIVNPLVQELCEQLRLVLEPTKMSRFKGDYRTGKRLNMRKIIPYIASQFRKDKIWLRRTKPSKREYEILLAVDDSSSMADNQSKELAFESLALLGKSLSFLEAGELAVASFGENVKLLQDFSSTFTTMDGVKLLNSFTFNQTQTKIAQLLTFARNLFIQNRNAKSKTHRKDISQLLIILSDGRGMFDHGKATVDQCVHQIQDCGIFVVFVILDNPLNKHSISDITRVDYDADRNLVTKSYMDEFPFPFYILLKEITSLPPILGEALRQWFELVTAVDH